MLTVHPVSYLVHHPLPQPCSLPMSGGACWPPTGASIVADKANQGGKPRRAKVDQRASGQVTRKAATSARPRPPPMAGPCTAATTGVAMANRRRALVVEGSGADAAGSVAAARERTDRKSTRLNSSH